MTTKLNNLFYPFLQIISSTQQLGINLTRIAILVIFVWIGGLKFWNYEAEGIVPFVANSPFMSFFYTKQAPEYKNYKMKEGEQNELKQNWHKGNNTYGFSRGLGILIMSIGILVFLGMFFPKIGVIGALLAIVMTLGTLSFLVTTPEVWVPDLGSGEYGFPLLSGAGRLVIKDTAILAGAIILLSESAQRILRNQRKNNSL
ncbi:YkgB family protein [Gabonibacter chumensis]|uniref:YkgB family protein n=1 Tax=Gabonibacter chumensis TaxID=2972474 RepID=UPI0025727FE4|nr:YkgB family protein [Gabonibacter chumensis]MCR9011945.1 YkgB family protein [Gabonibacter chumensis]